ncbi:MAG: hypothetical protein ACXWTY_11610 [Methylobacter sp.]
MRFDLDAAVDCLWFSSFAEWVFCFFVVVFCVETACLLFFDLAETAACVLAADLSVALDSFLWVDFDVTGLFLLLGVVLLVVTVFFWSAGFAGFECEVEVETVLVVACLLDGFVCVWPGTEKATLIPKSKVV